jgi:hypothetical protein
LSTNPIEPEDSLEPHPEDDAEGEHSPEPWTRHGSYIRDAMGRIVVRGRSGADARRIAAAINATREIPTDALENWFGQDVSDAGTRPDLEIDLEDDTPSPLEVRPPAPGAPSAAGRVADAADSFLFDRRVFDRRVSERRWIPDRRRAERRRKADAPAASPA